MDVPSSDSSTPSSPPSANKLAVTGTVRTVLWLAWLSFALLTALPVVIVLTLASLTVLWLGAVVSLLHTGGLAMVSRSFDEWWHLGLLLTLVCLAGSVMRWAASRRAAPESRERVIGPGGRVLRVVLRRSSEAENQKSIAAWIPDTGVIWLLYLLIVRWGEWGGNRLLPDGLSVVIIATCLYLFGLYLPLWLFRTGWWMCWGMMRIARGSEFRAGAFTVLFLLPGLTECGGILATKNAPPPSVRLPEDKSQPFADLESPRSFADLNRILLRATAEAMSPTQAFDADLRRYLRPWFDAGSTLREGVDIIWGQQRHSASQWWELLEPRSAWAQRGTADGPFQQCILDLYPGEVSRAVRQVRSQYRLERATSYDVAVGTLLAVCVAHERSPYGNLAAAFWRSVGNRALKQVDPNRRYRREVPQSALQSDSIDCSDPDLHRDIERACPSPWSQPEEQVAAWERLSLIQFCELTRPQRTILIQKGLLGFSDQELADEHGQLTASSAKVLYQNIRAKVKTKLDGMCRARRGIDDLLDNLRSRRGWDED